MINDVISPEFDENGRAMRRIRDTGIFNPLLYRLSYPGNGAH